MRHTDDYSFFSAFSAASSGRLSASEVPASSDCSGAASTSPPSAAAWASISSTAADSVAPGVGSSARFSAFEAGEVIIDCHADFFHRFGANSFDGLKLFRGHVSQRFYS